MPRLRLLWFRDLVAVLLVMGVSTLVFWLLPLPAEAGPAVRRAAGAGHRTCCFGGVRRAQWQPGIHAEAKRGDDGAIDPRRRLPKEPAMNPTPAIHAVQLVCAACGTKNRVPAQRTGEDPQCGRCGAALLPGAPIELSDRNFDSVVAHTDLPVVVDFYADWCGPCRSMAPHFARAAADAKGRALFIKVDTDANPAAAARFAVRSIPTVVRLQRGAEVDRFSGARGAAELLRFASVGARS